MQSVPDLCSEFPHYLRPNTEGPIFPASPILNAVPLLSVRLSILTTPLLLAKCLGSLNGEDVSGFCPIDWRCSWKGRIKTFRCILRNRSEIWMCHEESFDGHGCEV